MEIKRNKSALDGVCCVKGKLLLTYGKTYSMYYYMSVSGNYISRVTNDEGYYMYCDSSWFLSKEEFRNRKLNSILS